MSLPAELLGQLYEMVADRALPSRSQMLAELIRHELADHKQRQQDAVLAGTITLIYRADSGRVRQALAKRPRETVMIGHDVTDNDFAHSGALIV